MHRDRSLVVAGSYCEQMDRHEQARAFQGVVAAVSLLGQHQAGR